MNQNKIASVIAVVVFLCLTFVLCVASICVAGTFVSFLMMAWSIENYYIVLASRILDGILGGNVSLAQAYVSGMQQSVFCFDCFNDSFCVVGRIRSLVARR